MDKILVEATWDERPDVAAWLLATAASKGVDGKLIETRNEGFLVPAELLDDVGVEVTSEEPLVVTATVAVTPPVDRALYDVGPDNVTTVPPVERQKGTEIGTVPPEPDRETVRVWAKEQGMAVADKGRLSRAVYDAWWFAQES